MSLTPTEEKLIDTLVVIEAEEDDVVAIVLSLQTEEAQLKMIDWLNEHLDASVSDMLEKTLEIRDEFQTKASKRDSSL